MTEAGQEGYVHETPPVVWSSMLIGTAAMLILGVQPILLGGLTEVGRLTAAGLGLAAMLEILGLAIGSTFGPYLMNTGSMRMRTALACLALAAVNMGVYLADTQAPILCLRAAAGLLEGLMLGSVNVVLTHTRRPERMNGLLLGLSTIPQVIAAYLLPVLIIPRFGLNAGFGLLAALALLAAGCASRLVDHVKYHAPQGGLPPIRWSPALVAFMGAVLLQNAGIGAAWNYVERLAHQHGLPPAVAGAAIAGSLAFQVAGALLAAWMGWRLVARAVLVSGALLQAGLVIVLAAVGTPLAFIAALSAFGLFWLALQPFQVAEIIALDPSRRVALLLTPLALTGISLGPLLVSFEVTSGDVSGAFWGAGALLLLSGGLYAGAHLLAVRSRLAY
jgi:hypothetical protein